MRPTKNRPCFESAGPAFVYRIAQIAAHLAHSRSIPRDAAERCVRKLVDEAWSAYHELGAPLGDDNAGLAS
jgi:hypothetical protein